MEDIKAGDFVTLTNPNKLDKESYNWAEEDNLPLNEPLKVEHVTLYDWLIFEGYGYLHPAEKFAKYNPSSQVLEDELFAGIDNQRIKEHHRKFPHIYEKFRDMAVETKSRGFNQYSAAGIRELVRWQTGITGDGQYKIQNSFTPMYARMVMNELPEMEGFFKTKKTRVTEPTQDRRTEHE